MAKYLNKEYLIRALARFWPQLSIGVLFTVLFFLNYHLTSYQIADDSFRFFYSGTDYYKNLFTWNTFSGAGGVSTNTLDVLLQPLLLIVKVLKWLFGGLGAQAIFSYCIFLAFPYSIWPLTGIFTRKASIRLCGTLLYALNIVLLRNWLRNILFIDVMYIMAPIIIFLGYKYFTTKQPKFLAMILGLQLLNAITGLNPAYFCIEILAVNIVLVYFCLARKGHMIDLILVNVFAYSFLAIAAFSYIIFYLNKGALLADPFSNNAILGQIAAEAKLNSLSNVLHMLNADILSSYGYWGGKLLYPFSYVVSLIGVPWFECISLTPIVALTVLLLRHRKSIFVLYLMSIFLVCVFIVKGAGDPFGSLIANIIANNSLGTIFRNPQQKVGYILVLALVLCITYALSREKNKRLVLGLSLILIACSVLLAGQLFTGQLFTPYSFSNPPDYYLQAAAFINKTDNIHSIYSLPYNTSDFQYLDFGYEGYDLFKFLAPAKKIYERKSNSYSYKSTLANNDIEAYFRSQPNGTGYFSDLMKRYDIDTVVLHYDYSKENSAGIETDHPELYEHLLLSDPGLGAPVKFGKLDIFQLKSVSSTSLLQSDVHIEYVKLSPVEYYIRLSGVRDSALLSFADTYHSAWKLYPSDPIQCQQNCAVPKELGLAQDLGLLFTKPFADSQHTASASLSNQWRIDTSEMSSRPGTYIRKNSDGSYDISLRLFFDPQIYFYISLAVAAIIYSVLIVYLRILFKHESRK